ncbi:fructose-bisphosphatase class II [bacterium]|nr:fructose-bisphosphatase class II [bacterium]|tara:strand:+ start:145 stop:1110 length:966 start_codon:yes stop_codon:yes gene_type:complete
MSQDLIKEFVKVTEVAAIAAAAWAGKGDAKAADKDAVDAMRARINTIEFDGIVVIGEGSKDEAPELYQGEKVGTGTGQKIDLAVDPLECTDSLAKNRHEALAVIAAGPRGSLLSAPDTYMDKIAVGPKAVDVIDLDLSPTENIKNVANALGKKPEEMVVMALDRPRHEELIKEMRATGATVNLIPDGDVIAAILTCIPVSGPGSGVDMLLNSGGSAEAVQAATAVRLLGGQMVCRFKPRNDKDAANIKSDLAKIGITDPRHIFTAKDLAKGDGLMFIATGVLSGALVKGVQKNDQGQTTTQTVVISGSPGKVEYFDSVHEA